MTKSCKKRTRRKLMNETMKLLKSRRSIRNYLPEQLPEDVLDQILQAAISAPNAVNQQKYHFTILQNEELKNKINETIKDKMKHSGVEFLVNQANKPEYAPLHHAPTVIFVTGEDGAQYIQIDCALAAENIVTAAQSLGVASCVTTSSLFMFNSECGIEIKRELGIPDGYSTVCAVALGYPSDVQTEPNPSRRTDVFNFIR